MADDRELDDLLDRALSTYADQEPDASLRARISSRVEDVTPRPWRMGLLAAVATSAAAMLCTVLLHPAARSPVRQSDTAPSVASNPASPVRSVEAQQRVQPRYVLSARQQRKSHPHAVAHSASVPTPGPMTNEESLLLKFVADHPEQAQQILAHRDTAPLETKPISIAPIRIAALSDIEQAQPWQ